MAKGDVKSGIATAVADGSYMTIQPPAGEEWCILKIMWEAAVELYFYDGTTEVLFDSDTARGYYLGKIPITNIRYVRVKNVSGAAQDMAYSGYQTK
jgi:hypothetical protein